MTTKNWPDPKRPGVPLFPERDGWHVVTFWRSDRQVTGFWHAEKQKWGSIDGVYKFTPQDAVNNIKYDAASLTPMQINEILVAERECIKSMVRRACNLGSIITPRQRDMIIAGVDSETAIRNLGSAP